VPLTDHSAAPGSVRYKRIRNCLFLSGLSVFAQLYLFQSLLAPLCTAFSLTLAESSLAVSFATAGMAAGCSYWLSVQTPCRANG